MARDRAREAELPLAARQLIDDYHAALQASGAHRSPRWRNVYEAFESGDPEVYKYFQGVIFELTEQIPAHQAQLVADAEEARWNAQALEVDPDLSIDEMSAVLRGQLVWLYHGTSSAWLPVILRDGLRTDVEQTWDNSSVGYVFLTAAPGWGHTGGKGDAVFYAQIAAAKWGGEPVVLQVIVPWDTLMLDEDDADLSVGKYQFMSPWVPPSAIMAIDGERVDEA
jgi:hypothetical protein